MKNNSNSIDSLCVSKYTQRRVLSLKNAVLFIVLLFTFFGGQLIAQNPNLPPSGNFELIDWKVTLPDQTEVQEQALSNGFQSPNAFYTDPNTGAMVFRCPNNGATGGSTYPRSELREMLRAGNTSISTQGIGLNNWVFSTSSQSNQNASGGVDGTLTATVAVDHVSTSGTSSMIGRVIIGQIHAGVDEPCRLYYRKLPSNSKGSIYIAHEPGNGNPEQWYDMIGSRSSTASNPADGIALGEQFSYEIKVVGNTLTVTIIRPGKPDVVKIVDMSNSGFANDWMYFKAGCYNQNNSGNSGDYAQVSFFALNNMHGTGNNSAPTASITAPANGSSFTEGANITITANASDTDGTISKVEFFQGSTKLGEDLSAPYSYTWNSVSAGSYALTSKATDNLGATGTSPVVSITVNSATNSNPTTTITDPLNGSSFTAGANITITANASDTDGTINKVEFFQGATKLGEDLTSPYSYTWNNVSAGSYNLTSVATDNLGATGTSVVVGITVNSSGDSWTVISNENFESGWGIWNDGGSDASRYTGGTHAHQGSSALNIQDNTSTSVVTTNNLALASYTDLKVDFWFKPVSMENGEDFWLQISTNGGSSYTTVQTWVINSGSSYVNNNFYQGSVELLGYGLTDQIRVRFRCDASDNDDDIYLDEIVISAKGSLFAKSTTSTKGSVSGVPQEFQFQTGISKIYPNPVKGKMFVEYELANDSDVAISIFNISGQLVSKLLNNPQKAGQHTLEWNTMSPSGDYMAKGVYLVQFNFGGENSYRRVLILE